MCHFVHLSLQPRTNIFDCPWNFIQETAKAIIYHCSEKWIMRLSFNILFKGVLATQSILFETNTTAKYKIVWLSLKFYLQKCKGNYMSLHIDMDDGTIFQYFIPSCIYKTIHSLVTFLRNSYSVQKQQSSTNPSLNSLCY